MEPPPVIYVGFGGGCFDDGSYSVQLGSKRDAARLREDCRVDRRCLRQAAKLRIPGSGARNDRSAVQEAPEPTHFWTTSYLGGRDSLRAGDGSIFSVTDRFLRT